MFSTIIATLGITVIFADNATIPCRHKEEVYGCYEYKKKEIILGYNSPHLNQTFYHEMAHAMFADDFPRYNEELPKSFVEYMDDKSYFKYKEPELYWLFENKLKQYETSIQS